MLSRNVINRLLFVIVLLHLFFISTFLNFHFQENIFIFRVQIKGDIVCILHMFFDGATYEIMIYFFVPMTDY